MILGKKFSRRRVTLEAVLAVLVVLVGVAVEDAVSHDVYNAIIRGLITLLTVLMLAFVTIYSRNNWRATAGGRHLMTLSSAFLVILLLALSAWVFGDYQGRDVVRIAAYAFGAYAVGRLVWAVTRERHEYRKARRLAEARRG